MKVVEKQELWGVGFDGELQKRGREEQFILRGGHKERGVMSLEEKKLSATADAQNAESRS